MNVYDDKEHRRIQRKVKKQRKRNNRPWTKLASYIYSANTYFSRKSKHFSRRIRQVAQSERERLQEFVQGTLTRWRQLHRLWQFFTGLFSLLTWVAILYSFGLLDGFLPVDVKEKPGFEENGPAFGQRSQIYRKVVPVDVFDEVSGAYLYTVLMPVEDVAGNECVA